MYKSTTNISSRDVYDAIYNYIHTNSIFMTDIEASSFVKKCDKSHQFVIWYIYVSENTVLICCNCTL